MSASIGSGRDTIQVDIYKMVFSNRVVEFTAQTVGCIPVLTYEKNRQTHSVVVSEYMDIHLGIKNRHVFDIPKECSPAQQQGRH